MQGGGEEGEIDLSEIENVDVGLEVCGGGDGEAGLGGGDGGEEGREGERGWVEGRGGESVDDGGGDDGYVCGGGCGEYEGVRSSVECGGWERF